MEYVVPVNLTAEVNNNTSNEPIIADFSNIDNNDKNNPTKDIVEMNPKTEKLLWHYKLGHAPFATINRMAEIGQLPKRLAKVMDPKDRKSVV